MRTHSVLLAQVLNKFLTSSYYYCLLITCISIFKHLLNEPSRKSCSMKLNGNVLQSVSRTTTTTTTTTRTTFKLLDRDARGEKKEDTNCPYKLPKNAAKIAFMAYFSKFGLLLIYYYYYWVWKKNGQSGGELLTFLSKGLS